MALPADKVESIVAQIRWKIKKAPDLGIICGSGLGGLAKTLENPITVKYEDIHGFPQTTVKGHAGELVFGSLGGKYVVCMKGRFHCYEGHTPKKLLTPVYVMAALGIKVLIVTNAAGGLNASFQVGDLMIIKDQISIAGLAGNHPLVGKNDLRFGPRFPAMNGVFNKDLQKTMEALAKERGVEIRKGVYFGCSGPTYETPAEINAMRVLGGDSVGMSTVFEVMAAAHAQVPVLGLSLITNRCLGPNDEWDPPTHTEVLEATQKTQTSVQGLVSAFVKALDLAPFPASPGFEHFKKVRPGRYIKPFPWYVTAAARAFVAGPVILCGVALCAMLYGEVFGGIGHEGNVVIDNRPASEIVQSKMLRGGL